MNRNNVAVFPIVSLRPDWNDAVDRVVLAERDTHGHLADCLTEALFETDPDRIARIAEAVKAIELDAAVTLTAIVDREDQLRARSGRGR